MFKIEGNEYKSAPLNNSLYNITTLNNLLLSG